MKLIDARGLQPYDPSHLLIEPTGWIYRSRLPNVATTIQLVSDTAYFVYVGRTSQTVAFDALEFYVDGVAVGSGTLEVGLFSTPDPPRVAGQSLTKLIVVGASNIDAPTSKGVKWNSNLNFAYGVPIGTHVWAGIRTASYSTQPRVAK